MMWDLVAIWIIVLSVITWFIRDEIQRSQKIPARRLASSLGRNSRSVQPEADAAHAAAMQRKFVRSLVSKID